MNAVEFETPDNITVQYRLAGPGTRFVAWMLDYILICLTGVVLFLAILLLSALAGPSLQREIDGIERQLSHGPTEGWAIVEYFAAVILLVWSLSSILYFGLFEWLMRGQTPGKRLAKIRVTGADGFSLTLTGLFIRNLLRPLDHIPLLWIVPLITQQQQRLGDLLGRTIVVNESRHQINELKTQIDLAAITDQHYRFPPSALDRGRPEDIVAVERILSRLDQMPAERQGEFLEKLTTGLVVRLQVEPPPVNDRRQFLHDYLAAHYRRQDRQLS